MAFGALASGLLGAAAAAGGDAKERMSLANKGAFQKRILDMETEAKLDYDARVSEFKRTQAAKTASELASEQQSVLNTNIEQQAQAVSGTPGAEEFVRKEMGASPMQEETARRGAARKLGLLDVEENSNARIQNMEANSYNMKKTDETLSETIRHNKASEAIDALAKKNAAEGDTARIKNAKYLLENKIATNPADAWEKASELGGKNAEDVLMDTARRIKSDANKNGDEMTEEAAVQQAKALMKAVKNTSPGKIAVGTLPPGAKQIGTSKGKPVYQTPDGKRFIGE